MSVESLADELPTDLCEKLSEAFPKGNPIKIELLSSFAIYYVFYLGNNLCYCFIVSIDNIIIGIGF